jgi:hypothetical protein
MSPIPLGFLFLEARRLRKAVLRVGGLLLTKTTLFPGASELDSDFCGQVFAGILGMGDGWGDQSAAIEGKCS